MASNDDTLAHTNDASTGATSALQCYTVTISTGGTCSSSGGTSTPSSSGAGHGNIINLHGGQYTITSVCNPPHELSSQNQPKPTATRAGQVLSFGPEGFLAFNQFLTAPVLARGADGHSHSRQGVKQDAAYKDEQSFKERSDEVSAFWNTKIRACQSIYNRAAGTGPIDLEFALMGTSVLDVEDARLGRMSVTFPGVGFGSATTGTSELQSQDLDSSSDGKWKKGKWWFGGQTFEHTKEVQSRSGGGSAHTVRALASDREGRARYFYFSPSFKVFGSDCEMEAGGGDIVLTRIYGH